MKGEWTLANRPIAAKLNTGKIVIPQKDEDGKPIKPLVLPSMRDEKLGVGGLWLC